ncbi:MAG: hypothetical protein LBG89_00920 [Rickettsiales bacterium]|jgi:hypothetical protein|nr:hypothetical protein [Rickettsiales bacterium]
MLFKKDFSAGGISFSAWLDTHDHAAFVLDMTRDDILPDAMVVIDQDASNPDRKWDDILRKDFDTDPEIVRPRQDNKYQKLDILYMGLSVYQAAVDHMMTHGDASGEIIRDIGSFRLNAAAASAAKRIADNRVILKKVSKTMESTKKTAAKIRAEIAQLTERLAAQKTAAGFQPSRAAASKILKTQSMIEALQEKDERNDTRAKRTAKKIAAARREIQEFADRLERLRGLGAETAPLADADDYDEYDYDGDESESPAIAPLLDDDPNIVDKSKAFQKVDYKEREMQAEFKPMQWAADVDEVETPTPKTESRIDEVPASGVSSGRLSATPPASMPSFAPPVSSGQPVPENPMSSPASGFAAQPGTSSAYVPRQPMPAARPDAAPGAQAAAVARSGDTGGRKPSEPGGGYYMLLLVLIVVSIATLYVYQDKLNTRILPHLNPNATELAGHEVPANEPEPASLNIYDETAPAFLDNEQLDYIDGFNQEVVAGPESELEPLTREELAEYQPQSEYEPELEPEYQPEPAYEYSEEIVYDETAYEEPAPAYEQYEYDRPAETDGYTYNAGPGEVFEETEY